MKDFSLFKRRAALNHADIKTEKKTQKYYFLNRMKYIEGSLMKSSGKISREH